jgi:hypothetical protein
MGLINVANLLQCVTFRPQLKIPRQSKKIFTWNPHVTMYSTPYKVLSLTAYALLFLNTSFSHYFRYILKWILYNYSSKTKLRQVDGVAETYLNKVKQDRWLSDVLFSLGSYLYMALAESLLGLGHAGTDWVPLFQEVIFDLSMTSFIRLHGSVIHSRLVIRTMCVNIYFPKYHFLNWKFLDFNAAWPYWSNHKNKKDY